MDLPNALAHVGHGWTWINPLDPDLPPMHTRQIDLQPMHIDGWNWVGQLEPETTGRTTAGALDIHFRDSYDYLSDAVLVSRLHPSDRHECTMLALLDMERTRRSRPRRCSHCEGISTEWRKVHKCSRCRIARYCSSECQLADWSGRRGHKNKCAVWARLRGWQGSATTDPTVEPIALLFTVRPERPTREMVESDRAAGLTYVCRDFA